MTRTQSDAERRPRSIEPRTSFALAFAVVLLVAAVAGPAVLPVAATQDATISADPNTPGNTSTHTATLTPDADEAGSSLNGIKVDYSVSSNPADVGNVDQSDVVDAYIRRDNGTIVDVSDDLSGVSGSNNGETVKFTFGGSYDIHSGDTVVIEYEDVVNPDSAGDYTVEADLNDQSVERPAEATLTIEEATTDDGTSDDGTSDDGSTDDGSTDDSTSDTTNDTSENTTNDTDTSETNWTVDGDDDGTQVINVTNPDDGEPVSVDLPRTATENETGLTALTADVTPNGTENFSLLVNVSADGPAAPTGLEHPTYLAVEDPDDALGTVTVRFAVDRQAFDVDDPDRVGVFERDGDGWNETNATLVNETAGSYVFEVTTDEPTTFVVGTEVAVYSVTETEVEDRELEPDETVEVTATVTNDGLATELKLVGLRREGTFVDGEGVTLAPGEEREVTLTDDPGPGEYSYSVAGTDVGDVTVQATETPETGEVEGEREENVEATPDDTGENDDGSSLPSPLALVVGAVLLAALAGVAARVRG